MSVTIRPAPPTANVKDRRRWQVNYRRARSIKADAGWQLKAARRHWPRPPLVVRSLRLARHPSHLADPSGVIESLKAVVDAAVEVGLLPDDDAGHVRYAEPAQEVRKGMRMSELIVTFEADGES